MEKQSTVKTGTYAVRLKLFKGRKTYDAPTDGKITSFNQEMDAPIYPSFEWGKFIENVSNLYSGVQIVSIGEILSHSKQNPNRPEGEMLVTTSISKDEIDSDVKSLIEADINGIFEVKDKPKTADEKIAELQAKLEALTNANAITQPVIQTPAPPKDDQEDESLEALQVKYEALTGKKPNQLWKERRLLEEIKTLQSK